jgi:hypothetical protein
MTSLYALTDVSLPAELNGSDAEYSIRALSEGERFAVEDHFFAQGVKIQLSSQTVAVIVPLDRVANATTEEFAILVECALGILALSGFLPVRIVARFNDSSCADAVQRPYPTLLKAPTFPKRVGGKEAVQWLRHFFQARAKTKGLHITADRFVRYLEANDSRDSLVDLCICLESLIEAQTEISFRFATCLSKVCSLENRVENSDLLSDLYSLRSKVVHGTDSTKEHRRIEPNASKLRHLARAILSSFVLYLTDHSKDEWKRHLRDSLLA